MRQPLAKRKNRTGKPDAISANIGYEAQHWRMADARRGRMDAENKHVVLGLLFLNDRCTDWSGDSRSGHEPLAPNAGTQFPRGNPRSGDALSHA
jgi:hypothetical protein